jgi:hypothetical protein
MKLVPCIGLTTLCFGCSQKSGGAAEQPIRGEVRNVSSTCKAVEYDSLGYQDLECEIQGELALSGVAAGENPWNAFLQRLVNGKEDVVVASNLFGRSVLTIVTIEGAGKFADSYVEKRPLKDARPPPKIEYRVVALQPLVSVKQ